MSSMNELSALDDRPTSELIANRLREGILGGLFRSGEQVTEAKLATGLGVSRGPIREALQRLSQEGLLVSRRNRGMFVLELTATDVAEIYAARKAIEIAAAEAVLGLGKSTVVATAQTLGTIVQEMPTDVSAGDWPRVAALDFAFHNALVAASRNSRLSRIYATLAAESRICMVNLEGSYARVNVLAEEHERIVQLLASGRVEALRLEIVKHMESAVVSLTASMGSGLS